LFAELVVEKGGDVLDGAVFVGTVRRDGERRAKLGKKEEA
jgi:hypothetical protein